MGRKKAKVWNEFTIVENKDGQGTSSKSTQSKSLAICNYCKSSSAFPNATRMNEHLAQCRLAPNEIKKMGRDAVKRKGSKRRKSGGRGDSSDDEDDPSEVITNSTIAVAVVNTSETPAESSTQATSDKNIVVSKQLSIKSFVEKTPPAKKKKLDELMARAMYASNTPLSLFGNPYWQAFFSEMRPTYSVPSAHEFSNPLLNAEYSRVMLSAAEKLKSAIALALLSDGWSNGRGEGIVNFLISTPSIVFIKNVVPGQNRENAEYVGNQLINVVEECKTKRDVDPKKFFILITDNASVMKAAWVMFLNKYPHMCAAPCAAHSLNLLFSDIMRLESMIKFYREVKHVVKNVKKKSVVLAVFESKQTEDNVLKLPPSTRWAYVVLCLESLLANKSALQQTVICDKIKDLVAKKVRSNVLDEDGFWNDVQNVYNFLLPLHSAIKQIESDTATLSLVPELSKTVQTKMECSVYCTPLNSEEKESVLKSLIERMHNCNSEVHFAANLLDPRFQGRNLDSTEIHSAMDFINQQSIHLGLDKASVIADLAAYRTKSGFYSRDYLWDSANSVKPEVWWGGLCASQPLQPMASRFLSVPPTSGGCERDWSIQGAIHTKPRNRLKNERVEKLKAIKQNLQYSAHALVTKKKKKKECPNVSPNSSFCSDGTRDEEEIVREMELVVSDWSDSDSCGISSDSDSDSDFDVPLSCLQNE